MGVCSITRAACSTSCAFSNTMSSSHACVVFLITPLSLKQALVCFSDVMSHLADLHRWPSLETLGDPPRDRRTRSFKSCLSEVVRLERKETHHGSARKPSYGAQQSTPLQETHFSRVEASPSCKKCQTKMRRSSSVANNWLMLSSWAYEKRFCEQQCATRAAAREPSERASSLAAAGRQDRDRQALQQTSRWRQKSRCLKRSQESRRFSKCLQILCQPNI